MEMDDLRSWWEVPSIAHFCSLFRSAFDLTDFDIEDLEEAFIESEREEGSEFILELVIKLLNGCYRKEVSPANYDLYVKDIIKYKWENIESPIHEKETFKELTLREKVELLHALCEYRLDGEDVPDLLKGFEGENMRVEPLGKDKDGSTYWYFYGSRLYKEDPEPKKEISKAEKRAKDKKRRQELQKKKKEEKLKKKQDKKKEKAIKKSGAKKSKEETPKKQEKQDPNIRRSGRIRSKKTVEPEKDSESSDSTSSDSSDESEEEESTTEEEEELEEEKEEPVKGGRRGKQKTPVKAKTPAKKGKQPKETSKSTSKKGGRRSQTPKQQKSEPVVSQSDSSIRRSSRIKCKKEKPPPPPKFDSDTEEEELDNDDIDSGHESLESDDDKSVKSEVSKYSTTSNVSKAPGRARKVPMSKINLNKKFNTAEDTEDEDGEKDGEKNEGEPKDEQKEEEKKEDLKKDATENDKNEISKEMEQESEGASNQDKTDSLEDKKEGETNSDQETKETTEQKDTCETTVMSDSLENVNDGTNCTAVKDSKVELNGDDVTDKPLNEVDNSISEIKEENKPESMDVDESSETNTEQKDKDTVVKDDDTMETEQDSKVVNGESTNSSESNTSAEQGSSMKEGETKADHVTDEGESEITGTVKTEPNVGDEKEMSFGETSEIKTDTAAVDTKTDNTEDEANVKDSTDVTVKDETIQDTKAEAKEVKKADILAGLPKLTKPAVPPPPVSSEGRRWHLVCSTLDDWVNLAEWFKDSTVRCEKSLSKIITEDFLPVLPEIIEAREKERRKKLAELEIRRSERITYKQREKIEQEKILAEALAEEEKAKLQAEEERRLKEEQQRLEEENRLREERARAREDRAKRLSMREERARLLAEGKEIPPELIYTGTQKYKDDEDSDDSRCDLKDEEDYQNLTKVINAMKVHKDCWPFLEPVTDEVAPGYSEVIKRPIDITKIEGKVSSKDYRSTAHFLSDFRLMFNNCKRFNGPDSEFTECARSMERMLKKYVKRFMTDSPADSYYEDKDFTMSNMRGATGEKRYRPKRAASSRALQTVHRALNDDGDYEESSDEDDDEKAPARKRPREFPARAVTGQSRLLQEMIELKRQRERKQAAGSLDNCQIVRRGPEHIAHNPAGGIMVIPKDELPPTGVLKLATTREIKRKVDPITLMNKNPASRGGMSVFDKRRTANPPKTIRIVAASNTLSGNASVKETAESVKVSSDGFLIIGGKNSGIKVSENTKIVIQPPAPPGTGQSPAATGSVAGSKEIFIRKMPAQQAAQQAADSTSSPAAKPQKYVNNMSTPTNSAAAQNVASVKRSPAIITASSTSVQPAPNTANTNQNSILKAQSNITPGMTKPESPDLHKKQVDIATRIMMLNQQKRKMMVQKQQAASSDPAVVGPKVIKLDNTGYQSIEDRLRDPAIDAKLGSVTKEVVSSVDIASDILDTYYSVLNQRTVGDKSAAIPSTVDSLEKDAHVSPAVSNSLRNKLLPTQQTDNSSVGFSDVQYIAQTLPSVISNGPGIVVQNNAHIVTSQIPSQTVPVTVNALNVGSVNSGGHSATVLTNPSIQQVNVSQVVGQSGMGVVSVNNLQVSLPETKPEGPVSVQTVLNSATNLTGGKVQVNVPNISQQTVSQVALTNFALPTLGNTIGASVGNTIGATVGISGAALISAAPDMSTVVYTQQSPTMLANVATQQIYTNNTVPSATPEISTVAYTQKSPSVLANVPTQQVYNTVPSVTPESVLANIPTQQVYSTVPSIAPEISTVVYTQQSPSVLANVNTQQIYTNNTVPVIDNTVAPTLQNTTTGFIDNTVGPIEALFASNTGNSSVSFSTNPQTLSTPQTLVDIPLSSQANALSPSKTNRLNLFDMFETNNGTSANANAAVQPVTNQSIVQQEVVTDNVAEQAIPVKSTGKQSVMSVPSSSTVNYGSPLKTLSIMEALKSKLNPQKVNQTSESTPVVTQSTLPKRNLFPVLCSAVDVDACFPQPAIELLNTPNTACIEDKTDTPSSITACIEHTELRTDTNSNTEVQIETPSSNTACIVNKEVEADSNSINEVITETSSSNTEFVEHTELRADTNLITEANIEIDSSNTSSIDNNEVRADTNSNTEDKVETDSSYAEVQTETGRSNIACTEHTDVRADTNFITEVRIETESSNVEVKADSDSSNTACNLPTNQDHTKTDLETSTIDNQPCIMTLYLNSETNSQSNADLNISVRIEPDTIENDYVYTRSDTNISNGIETVGAGLVKTGSSNETVANSKGKKRRNSAKRLDISQQNRIEIIYRKSYLTGLEDHMIQDISEKTPDAAKTNNGHRTEVVTLTDASTSPYIGHSHQNECKVDTDIESHAIQSVSSSIKPSNEENVRRRPDLKYIMMDRDSPIKEYQPMSYRTWLKNGHTSIASFENYMRSMGECEKDLNTYDYHRDLDSSCTRSTILEDRGARGDENFHSVQSWTELQRLNKHGGKPDTVEADDEQIIYFKLSDTVQTSSINQHSKNSGRRRLKKHQSSDMSRTQFYSGSKTGMRSERKYTPRRSRSCNDATDTVDVGPVTNLSGIGTVSWTGRIPYSSSRTQTCPEMNIGQEEFNKQKDGLMKVTFDPKIQQRRTSKSKYVDDSPNLNYVDLNSNTHESDLGRLRLKRRIERLSTRPVYTLQPLRSPNGIGCSANKSRKELQFTSSDLRPSQSDSSVQQQQEDFHCVFLEENQTETSENDSRLPYPCTEYIQTALDSSLTCDKDFFTTDLLTNLIPSNFGNGDFDIDPDLENIKDDIFELQDKYLVGHNTSQTSPHVNPVATHTVTQHVSTSQTPSTIGSLPSSQNQPWTNLHGTSIAGNTGLTMIEQTAYPSQVNIETNNPNQLSSVFPKHMSGTVVHINTQKDAAAPDRPSGMEVYTNQEYS